MNIKIFFAILIIMGTYTFPQNYLERQIQGNIPKDQIVSLSASLSFDRAIELLSKVSEKAKGKKIVSTIQISEPIGIELTNVPYDKALVALVQMKGLILRKRKM